MGAILGPAMIILISVAAMEAVAALVHRHLMHGFGWGWHRSHHEPHPGLFEVNDLYAFAFAGLAMLLMAAGHWWKPLFWVSIGLCVYGALYSIVHDGLVHQRWPFRHVPRRGYLKRLYQAHKLHHAVEGRDGCVSFGFLYAPPVEDLRAALKRGRETGPTAESRR
jgi:beta-carotene 3-hydroxylase